MRQGICFYIVDEEDQVVCTVAHINRVDVRYKVPFKAPELIRYSELDRDTSHVNLKNAVFVSKGRLTGGNMGTA